MLPFAAGGLEESTVRWVGVGWSWGGHRLRDAVGATSLLPQLLSWGTWGQLLVQDTRGLWDSVPVPVQATARSFLPSAALPARSPPTPKNSPLPPSSHTQSPFPSPGVLFSLGWKEMP